MMRPVRAHLIPSSLGLRQTGARAVGWLGLAAFVWATLGLPALHALEHAREAAADEAAHTDDVHLLLREVLARHRGARPHAAPGHHHDHHDGQPGVPGTPDPAHGRGSAQHFSIAVLAASPPRLPPRATKLETLIDW